jgi:carbamoyltransferase
MSPERRATMPSAGRHVVENATSRTGAIRRISPRSGQFLVADSGINVAIQQHAMKNLVLGLKLDPYHDTGAAAVGHDGDRVRVVAISEERLDRRKNSRAFPAKSIAYCLDALGCRLQDVRLVVADFIERPGVDDHWATPGMALSEAKAAFFGQLDALGIRAVFVEHHLCHAASAYFATTWQEALTVVIDGVGSNHETQSIFRCEGHEITKVATSRQPGIGWMYSAVTEKLLGFDHLQEGKTMGLAGHAPEGEAWRALFRHVPFDTDNPCDFSYPQFLDTTYPTWKLSAPAPGMLSRSKTDDPVSEPFAQYASAAQAELESSVLHLIEKAASLVPSRRLCYAGGVALNIPANRLILDSGLFDDLFIQPAASDAGIPLGAALLGYYSILHGSGRWQMTNAFLGRGRATSDLDDAAATWRGARSESSTADVAKILANDYLVAWYQGVAEYGPRALGHRSILCSPVHPRMKAYLNDEVKHREMFRPFAPIVPSELQHVYFDLPTPSPFMLLNSRVRLDKVASMPAVVHADGTARVQTISREDQPELHALLHEVGRLTGVPVLVNTSLNLAGEPIVETPRDAVDLFERSRLDALVMETHLLTKAPLPRMLQHHNPGVAAAASRGSRSLSPV